MEIALRSYESLGASFEEIKGELRKIADEIMDAGGAWVEGLD